ncbi:MAG: sporulation integral membrane protein YtvI [Eubacteriales bacterium]
MTETDRRKTFLINTTYVIFLFGLYYLFMMYAFWLFFPFLLALFVAMSMQRPINFLVKKTKLKKGTASVICIFLLMAIMLAILSLLGMKIVTEIQGLIKSLMDYAKDLPTFLKKSEATLLNAVRFLPPAIEKSIDTAIADLYSKLNAKSGFNFNFSSLSASLGGVWSTAKMLPKFFVAVIIAVVSCFFLTSDYDRVINFIKRQLPHSKREAVSLTKATIVKSVGKLFKAYAILMFMTFCEMLLGLNILRMVGLYKTSFLLATAVIVAIVDILPILGTGTILIPWTIYSLLSGNTGLGIGLLVLYILMYIIRQAVEPKLVAANLGLPPILTIMGMYIGAALFGFIGIFLVPLSIMVVKILNDEGVVKLWKSFSDVKPLQKDTAAETKVPAETAD